MPHLDTVIHFNFYEIQLQVQSRDSEILERLKKDFSFFYSENRKKKPLHRIDIYLEEPDFTKLPNKSPIFNRKNCITYQEGDFLFNDYHGEALSILDDITGIFSIYSSSRHRIHEIVYLFILSVVGKTLDQEGLHRIHACGFQYLDKAVVLTADSGIGKTTFLLNLLVHPKLSIYSDDTPLISSEGFVHPFPTRFGISGQDEFPLDLESSSYLLERKEFGTKKLVDFKQINRAAANATPCSFLVLLERSMTNEFKIQKMSRFKMFFVLFKNLVIGIGTPIIFEYFWRIGFKDFLLKTKIFFKRLKTAIKLLYVTNCYIILLSDNHKNNGQQLLEWLGKENS